MLMNQTASASRLKSLQVEALAAPPSKKGSEILVEARALSFNCINTKIRAGRLSLGMMLQPILVGVVVAIGPAVMDFKPGNEVFYES